MSKRLTDEEARELLRLLDAVEEDMKDVFEIVAGSTFGERELAEEEFIEKWGANPGQIYTECSRKKYRRFVKHAYLEGTDDQS